MSRQLESVLRQAGLATDIQIGRVRERVEQGGGTFMDVLVKEQRVSEDAIADAFAERMKVPRARVAAFLLDEETLRKVPERLARKHECLPLAVEGRVLVVAMVNPLDYRAIQDIEFASAMSVKPVVATLSEITGGIDERYGAEGRMGAFLANVPEAPDIQIVSEDPAELSVDVADSLVAAEVAPVVKMCNVMIYDAIKSAASDVHIEPALHDLQVRMRVDGVLRDYTRVPKWLHGPVVSRLKILAKLDIAERRLPQDGRVNVQYQGKSIDLRVSTLPTHFGEKMVLRILGGASAPNLSALGLAPAQEATLQAGIQQPQGMILVTGPTGSGKTTTLYSLLAWHHKPEVNIVTIEDPIEFQLAGINQVQINPKAGLTFASALRSILRQDPDVILVGETRDRETAEIACQAAMTGHMVLSTLHTNSAIAAVARLFDMGIDPPILASSLTMVIAQRLVRRVCGECREEYEPGQEVRNRVGLFGDASPVYRGRGCTACGGTGFSGRTGIYEIFKPNNAARKLINDRASESDLRYAARQSGMTLLREDALAKIRAGITSPDEVLRVVQLDETEIPCPSCKAVIESDFASCPYCRVSLKTNCAGCGQPLRLEWKQCPYCNTSVRVPPIAEAAGESRMAPEPAGTPEAGVAAGTSAVPRTGGAPAAGGVTAFAPVLEVKSLGASPAPTAPEAAVPDAWDAETLVGEPAEDVAADVLLPVPRGSVGLDDGDAPAAGPALQEGGWRTAPIELPDQPPAEYAAPEAAWGPTEALAEAPTEAHSEPPAEASPSRALGAVPQAPLEPPSPGAPETSAHEPASPAERTVDPTAGHPPLRVLVVDDDADIRLVVRATLRGLSAPVEVVEAENGLAAMEKVKEAAPDLVVLDVMMPEMDGFDTCRALRGNLRTAFIPILMLTASADQASRTKGYLIGTDDYMAKPFVPFDLKLRVSRLLRRTYGI